MPPKRLSSNGWCPPHTFRGIRARRSVIEIARSWFPIRRTRCRNGNRMQPSRSGMCDSHPRRAASWGKQFTFYFSVFLFADAHGEEARPRQLKLLKFIFVYSSGNNTCLG